MGPAILSISALLSGIGVLLVGNGLLGTLLGLRAGLEGFTVAITGAVMSAYFVGYIVGTYFCPALIARVGHIRAFAALAALASVASIAYGLLPHPIIWALLRVLSGVCLVGLYMVVESWLNGQTPHRQRGRIFAVYIAVTLVAMGLGQYLILVGDTRGLVPFALASMLFTLGLVPVALTRVSQPQLPAGTRGGLQDLYRASPLGFVGALTAGIVNGSFWGLGAVFCQRLGLSEMGIAAFMSATIFGGAVLQWPVGHLSDRRDRRVVLTLVSFAAAAVAVIAVAVMYLSLAALTLCAFLYGGLMFSLYGLSVAHATDAVAPAEVLEATRGLLLVYGVGAALGPSIAGPLMDRFGTGTLALFSAATLALLGSFGTYRVGRTPAVPTEEQHAFVPLVRTSPVALEMHPQADLEPELDLK